MIITLAISTVAQIVWICEPRHEKNLSSGFQTRSDTNQAVQLRKMVRGLEFQI